jgi:hypothetical protein
MAGMHPVDRLPPGRIEAATVPVGLPRQNTGWKDVRESWARAGGFIENKELEDEAAAVLCPGSCGIAAGL